MSIIMTGIQLAGWAWFFWWVGYGKGRKGDHYEYALPAMLGWAVAIIAAITGLIYDLSHGAADDLASAEEWELMVSGVAAFGILVVVDGGSYLVGRIMGALAAMDEE